MRILKTVENTLLDTQFLLIYKSSLGHAAAGKEIMLSPLFHENVGG